MQGLLDELDIIDGSTTKLRGIPAPEAGDEYMESYYRILEAVEKNTVYFRDDVDDLPDPGSAYDTLVGIAPSQEEHLDGRTLHLYDSDTESWVDTFAPLNSVIEKIDESDIDVDLGDEYDSFEELIAAIDANKEDLTELEETAGSIEEDISEIETFINNLHKEVCSTGVLIKQIETEEANNREYDYTLIFDLGHSSVGKTVYMEARSNPEEKSKWNWSSGAEWSGTLEANTDNQRISQDGDLDVGFDELIVIRMYSTEQKETLLYETEFDYHAFD